MTGLVVNKKVNVPRNYLRGLRALLYIWEEYGSDAAAKALHKADPDPNWPPRKPSPGLAEVVRGRVQYVASIRGKDDPAYLKLAARLAELDKRFEKPTTPPSTRHKARVYTEGSSDIRHMRAAQHYFHAKGEYLELELTFDTESDRGSDQQLKKHCERLEEFGPKDQLSVCLFDSDSKVARDAVGPEGWRAYGPAVVAVGLAPPPWGDPHEKLCIELLHPDSVLKTKNAEGRRIYKTVEFHPATSLHESEFCAIPYAPKKSEALIQVDVFEAKTQESIGRSKADFARAIEEDAGSFGGLDFEGFRPTFDRIVSALSSLDA